MSRRALCLLIETFADSVLDSHSEHGDDTVVVSSPSSLPILKFLRDDARISMEMLVDLTAVDYLGCKKPRFEVVYHLYSLSKNHRLRVRIPVEETKPEVDSATELWSSALWMEREAFDLYGIVFNGHPDLRRLLLYPEFEGHPLRKDYDINDRQPRIPPRIGRRHL